MVNKSMIFILNLLFLILLFIPYLLFINYIEKTLLEENKRRAEAVSDLVIIMRKWMAKHGGIYLEKFPWVEENPFLKAIGIESKTYTKEGKILVLHNPALVTRLLSEEAKKNKLFWFKLTSEKYINPNHQPDEVEKEALKMFENNPKQKEYVKIDSLAGNQYLRLIKPLITEQACLKCHGFQGYKEGDVRGALSVYIPLDKRIEQISLYKKIYAGAFILFWIGFNLILLSFARKR